MTIKQIDPTNPDTTTIAKSDAKTARRKTASIRTGHRKTSGIHRGG